MPIGRSDFRGITDMYMDTSAYNLDPSFNYYLNDPRELDQRRLRAYKYFMDFYDGKQWPDMMSGTLSSSEWNPAFGMYYMFNEDFNRRTWNMSKLIVDKLITFTAAGSFTYHIPAELEDNPDEDQSDIKKTLDAVWYANRKDELVVRLTDMMCITGDVFIRLSYDPDFYAEDVGEIVLQVMDSRTVIPYWDPEDKTKMIACKIQYPLRVSEPGEREQDTIMYQEIHTATYIVTILDGEVQEVYPNPLGELMIVHIPNEPLPYRRFGRSDLESLILPSQEYNEKVSDLSEILAYHAAPITIIKGARVQNLERGARKVWGGIPKDGDVFNLNLEADLSSSLEYLDRLKQHIFELGSVPETTLSAQQEVSNTSAAALHVQYAPLIERAKKKQVYLTKGIQKINELILKFYLLAGVIEIPEDTAPAMRFRTVIEWGDSLPRDRSIDLNDISVELGLMLESKMGAMKRLGVENPERKMKEIEDEQKRQAELDYEVAGMAGDQGPGMGDNPMAGKQGVQNAQNASAQNPDVHGKQVANQAVKRSAQQDPLNKPKPGASQT